MTWWGSLRELSSPVIVVIHEGGHPECAARVPAIMDAMTRYSLLDEALSTKVVQLTDFTPATMDDIMRVHSEQYVRQLQRYSNKEFTERPTIIEGMGDTYATSSTFDASLKAAGAAMALVDEVVQSTKDKKLACSGFGICRPPGHHAVRSGPMGFCIFGTVSVAVRHAQMNHNLKKVMIYDFDVHHGNGTQDVFYDDPSVLFISTHQDGIYPGTGRINEVGSNDGEGTNINVPLPGGSGNSAALSVFENVVAPAAERFRPDIIFISAGYDAHFLDPLASLQFTSSTYNTLCHRLRQLANKICHGRIVLLLEGGYHLKALGESVVDSFFGLMGQQSIDMFDKKLLEDEPQDSVKSLLTEVKRIHLL